MPWKRVRCARGGGTSAASLAMKSTGSHSTWVVPFLHGVLSCGDSFEFDVEDPTQEQRARIARAIEVFKRGAPAVFVNGMAMSKPTASQTLAEYRSTRAVH